MMRVMSLPAGFSESTAQVSCPAVPARSTHFAICWYLPYLQQGLLPFFPYLYLTDFAFAPALVAPALTIVAVTVAFSVISSLVQMGISRRQMELAGKENGMTYAMITGVQKIKLSGAEKRAFARWGDLYAKEAKLK